LVEELNRLTKKGVWSQKEKTKSSVVHSSYPKKILRIQMLPNLSVTVHGEKNSLLNYEKVLIPFGAFPDQVFHLIDMSARDVCYNHFTEPQSYMSGNRKRTVTIPDIKRKFKPVLDFLFEKKYQLQVLIYFSKEIRKAEKEELEDDYSTEGN
jgi:hypothetical protein